MSAWAKIPPFTGKFFENLPETRPGVARQLKTALEAGDIDGARALSHTIKGVAGNISADKLFVAAAKLDRSLKTKDIPRALEQLPVFSYHLERIVNGVKALENSDPNTAAHTPGPEIFKKNPSPA